MSAAWAAPAPAKCADCKSWPALAGYAVCEFCLPYYEGWSADVREKAWHAAKHIESQRRAGTDRRETP